MANNGVSQHFKIDKGLDLTSDSQFATLSANTKIVYKPNSEKYVKNPSYSNVFDKAKSFATDEELSATETELGTVKSKSITAIDDANASGVCLCKNASGSQVDTFTCHVSKSASNPTLSWGSTATIGTIDGTAFKVTMPANPNTNITYSAGTALTLNGTTFNHNNYLDSQNGYYHTCIDPNGFKLNGNILSLTGLSIRFNEQGHVTGFKNADPVTVDLSSIANTGDSGVPTGIISMWAGAVGDIPAGWHLCDGTAGTPDLRNKFVIGAGNKYNPGTQGEFSTIGEGSRTWGNGDLSYSGGGGVGLRSIENPTNGTLTYVGTMTGTEKSMRLNFPIPFSSEPVAVMNAVIGSGDDGTAIARPNVLVDDCEPGYIAFTNPNNDNLWRVYFNITGITDPSRLVSNADNDYNYYALCYIMKT